jgi:hypothetical protein
LLVERIVVNRTEEGRLKLKYLLVQTAHCRDHRSVSGKGNSRYLTVTTPTHSDEVEHIRR